MDSKSEGHLIVAVERGGGVYGAACRTHGTSSMNNWHGRGADLAAIAEYQCDPDERRFIVDDPDNAMGSSARMVDLTGLAGLMDGYGNPERNPDGDPPPVVYQWLGNGQSRRVMFRAHPGGCVARTASGLVAEVEF